MWDQGVAEGHDLLERVEPEHELGEHGRVAVHAHSGLSASAVVLGDLVGDHVVSRHEPVLDEGADQHVGSLTAGAGEELLPEECKHED